MTIHDLRRDESDDEDRFGSEPILTYILITMLGMIGFMVLIVIYNTFVNSRNKRGQSSIQQRRTR